MTSPSAVSDLLIAVPSACETPEVPDFPTRSLSPNYKQKTEQTSPSTNKHNDAARLEIEKLRHELEIKSQEMSKMKEETKLANAMVEAAKAEADLAIAKANNKAATLEDQKHAMEKDMALKVAKLMQEQTMVQEEMRKKIQESARAASDAALAANNKVVSDEEKERQAIIEQELQRRNEELNEVMKVTYHLSAFVEQQ